ncbi:MAG TPA: PaaI family thioesterase, partial [Anaeromyxobacter sp.]
MPEKQPSSRSCFVCGRDNEAGLHSRWVSDRAAGEVRSTIVLAEHFHGYPGIVHGGIVAALLDEAMVRSLLLEGEFEDLMVTARMQVTYRRVTPTVVPVTIAGRLVKRGSSRATAEAEIRLADGTVTAEAEGLLTRPTPEVAAAWALERPYWAV